MELIKIATYNIQSGVQTTKGGLKPTLDLWKYFLPHSQKAIDGIADYVNTSRIDILTLTEADSGSLRSQQLNQVQRIAILTDLEESVFFPTFKVGPFVNHGNAILSRFPIIETKNYMLPGEGEPRSMGMAIIKINRIKVTILVAHLGLTKESRKEQLTRMAEIIRGIKGPVVLSGDLNTDDESELNVLDQTNLKRFSGGKTFPSWQPEKGLDQFAISSDVKTEKVYADNSVHLSDHLPCIAEVTLPQIS